VRQQESRCKSNGFVGFTIGQRLFSLAGKAESLDAVFRTPKKIPTPGSVDSERSEQKHTMRVLLVLLLLFLQQHQVFACKGGAQLGPVLSRGASEAAKAAKSSVAKGTRDLLTEVPSLTDDAADAAAAVAAAASKKTKDTVASLNAMVDAGTRGGRLPDPLLRAGTEALDDLVKLGARGSKESSDFFKNLATKSAAAWEAPDDILQLLDEVGEFAMDDVLKGIMGDAMSRVARHGGEIADPSFWRRVVPHLYHIKGVKAIKAIRDGALTVMKEYQPDELLQMQRFTDDVLERMLSVVDDAAEQGAQGLNLVVRTTAGELYTTAKGVCDKTLKYIYNIMRGRNPSTRDPPEQTIYDITGVRVTKEGLEKVVEEDLERVVKAEAAVLASGDDLTKSIDDMSIPSHTLTEKMAAHIDNLLELDEALKSYSKNLDLSEIQKKGLDAYKENAANFGNVADHLFKDVKGRLLGRKTQAAVGTVGGTAVGGGGGYVANSLLSAGGEAAVGAITRDVTTAGSTDEAIDETTTTSPIVVKKLASHTTTTETYNDYADHPRGGDYDVGRGKRQAPRFVDDRDYGFGDEYYYGEEEEEKTVLCSILNLHFHSFTHFCSTGQSNERSGEAGACCRNRKQQKRGEGGGGHYYRRYRRHPSEIEISSSDD
jgi:hypothetical protein